MDDITFPAIAPPGWFADLRQWFNVEDTARLQTACLLIDDKAPAAPDRLKTLAAMALSDGRMNGRGMLFLADALREAAEDMPPWKTDAHRITRRDIVSLASLIEAEAPDRFLKHRR